MHSLSHLVADCKIHGPLYSWSAYKFENFLGTAVKKEIRSGNLILSQFAKRLSEREPILHLLPGSKVKLNPVGLGAIKPNSRTDSVCVVNGVAVQITQITTTHVYGKVFTHLFDFYGKPRNSSGVGLYASNDLQLNVQQWPIAAFNNCIKCMILPNDGPILISALLHNM